MAPTAPNASEGVVRNSTAPDNTFDAIDPRLRYDHTARRCRLAHSVGTSSRGFSCMQALSPPPLSGATEGSGVGWGYSVPRIRDSGVRTRREASRQRRHHFLPLCSEVLLPLRSNGLVRCSPRLRRCLSATRSAHRRLWPSVRQVGVGHSKPPVKGSRLRSLEPLWGLFLQAPTQKQEAPTSTSEGPVGPSAVGRGSSHADVFVSG